MRNLKRALSLTLASVMLLGMMVVGTSAKGYDDVTDENNVEAIEVLQAIEVMVGDERGFGPERPVNRAEMAVVMGKLLSLDYDYYASSCPFNDVYDWARGWVGACYANKIVSGRGDGVYDPGATVTAVEAASMLMRALGYFQYANDVADGFELSTVRQGTKIGIFDQVGSSATEPMTRDQVAQMVLNALQTGMVEPDGQTINLTTPDGQVYTGKVNYVNITSSKPFARTIGRVQATSVGSTNDGYIVDLGEQLYKGNLKLNDTTDAFERPARHWEYDGKDVGTYVKKELLRESYSEKVTGKMLYELITKPTIEDYGFTIAIDGIKTVEANKNYLGTAYFTEGNLVRTNTEKVGETGNGVLTEVYVDTDNEEVYIAVINTYLAKAIADYNAKKDEATFEVWKLDDKNKSGSAVLVKTGNKNLNLTVSGEDFDIEDVKEDDIVLVNVAEGEVKKISDPQVIDNTEISAFKNGDWVNADGTKYDYANTIRYDTEVLDQYDDTNMKDTTYRIFLDKYGYAIGIEIVAAPDQYVFLTGIDGNSSNLKNHTAEGNVIFLDGTMQTIKINMEKSKACKLLADYGVSSSTTQAKPFTDFTPGALWNTWCTYSVDANGVYTLTQVANTQPQHARDDNGKLWDGVKRDVDKVGQGRNSGAKGASDDYLTIIDKKRIGLNGIATAYDTVYGNDDSVYITVGLKEIDDATRVNPYIDKSTDPNDQSKAVIIDDVDSVITGVQNAALNAFDYDQAAAEAEATLTAAANNTSHGVYTLFKDNGYVIAAIVVGEDDGVSTNYAYVTSKDGKNGLDVEEWNKGDGKWKWTREVIINGEKTTLTEVGDNLTADDDLDNMLQNEWYEVKYKADGTIRSVKHIASDDVAGTSTPSSSHNDPDGASTAALGTAKDDVFCVDYTHMVTGTDYPKYVGEISMVKQANVDNNGIVYFEDMTDKAYGLSARGNSLYVKTSENTEYGFAVSANAKVVLVQDKWPTLNAPGNVVKMDYVEVYESGQSALKRAIDYLNDNDDGDKFVGYLSAVFENGVATSVIIYDAKETVVDQGETTVGGSHSKATVDPSTLLIKNVEYTDGDFKTPVGNALNALGFEVTAWDYDSANKGNNPTNGSQLTAVKNSVTYTFTFSGTPTSYMNVSIDGKKATPVVATKTVQQVAGITASGKYVKYIVDDGTDTESFVAGNASGVALTPNVKIFTTPYVEITVGSTTKKVAENSTVAAAIGNASASDNEYAKNTTDSAYVATSSKVTAGKTYDGKTYIKVVVTEAVNSDDATVGFASGATATAALKNSTDEYIEKGQTKNLVITITIKDQATDDDVNVTSNIGTVTPATKIDGSTAANATKDITVALTADNTGSTVTITLSVSDPTP